MKQIGRKSLSVLLVLIMVIGLLPVTGIPLPFVSYGGSNMLTNMMGIGLVENVVMRSRQHDLQQRTSNSRIMQLRRE